VIKKLLFLSLIICTPQSYAMKRSNNHLQDTVSQSSFPNYKLWVPDVQNVIIDFSTIYTTEKKPKEAAYTANALARTNKQLNALINDPTFSDNLINTFAHKFRCSHESIARFLHTKQAKQRLALQYELKKLCYVQNFVPNYASGIHLKDCMTKDLDTLITRKVDLEFTYNHKRLQETPVMISLKYKNPMFKLLLEKGANINGCNSHDLTALNLTLTLPLYQNRYSKLLECPQLAINQQNKRGESALLRCLIHKKPFRRNVFFGISLSFITMIRDLLEAGADPELANNEGVTPMDAAKLLGNADLIRIIQHAIDQKHA
jgi:hypothetical protein